MKKAIYVTSIIVSFLLGNLHLCGQVTITGPSCVTSGVMYLYTINGTFDSSSSMKVCVTGGIIDTTHASCAEEDWLPFVKIAWNSNITRGSILITSSSGDDSLAVGITLPLAGGAIDSASLVQLSDSTREPAAIYCSPPGGGGCSPFYVYQWQQSANNMAWDDMPGATGQDLVFSAPVLETTYYRRKTKTTESDAEAYTQSAAVVINPVEN